MTSDVGSSFLGAARSRVRTTGSHDCRIADCAVEGDAPAMVIETAFTLRVQLAFGFVATCRPACSRSVCRGLAWPIKLAAVLNEVSYAPDWMQRSSRFRSRAAESGGVGSISSDSQLVAQSPPCNWGRSARVDPLERYIPHQLLSQVPDRSAPGRDDCRGGFHQRHRDSGQRHHPSRVVARRRLALRLPGRDGQDGRVVADKFGAEAFRCAPVAWR